MTCQCIFHLSRSPADNYGSLTRNAKVSDLLWPSRGHHLLSHDLRPNPHLFTLLPQAKHINGEGGSMLKCQLQVFSLKWDLKVCNLILLIYCELHFIFSNSLTCSSTFLGLLITSSTVHPKFIPSTQPDQLLHLHQLCYLLLYSSTFHTSCFVISEKELPATRCHSALFQTCQLQQLPSLSTITSAANSLLPGASPD